jgi:vacuolar-type H+-ATPase subunit I/STV1
MEAISHVLTGVLIQLLCYIFFTFPLNIIFTIIFAFLSHFLIDALAKFTYHTPEPHKEDTFWVVWHIITPLILVSAIIWSIIIGKFFFFLLGAFFANLVDIIDWGIYRPFLAEKRNPEGSDEVKPYIMHRGIDFIRKKVPPFSWLPNLNENKKGVITEIAVIILLWGFVILLL